MNEIAARFWERVDTGSSEECWEWNLSVGNHGYGQWYPPPYEKNWLAHRLAWTLVNGDIPNDLTVDHLCHNRPCCNPAHLRLLPNVVNAADNGQSTKTHCPQGHEYTSANTSTTPVEGHRWCRTCRKARNDARYRKNQPF